MKILIPSRRRADQIEEGALSLFPNATVCVGSDEAPAYRKLTKNILEHPPDVVGMGPLRQWILDHVHDETVFMVDDDVYQLYSLTHPHALRLTAADDIRQVVENAAACARGVGARIFGFNQAWDVRKFSPLKPIAFVGWVGGAVGVIGRDLRFDTTLKLRTDIDACLTSLLTHRLIYQDLRFAFAHRRFEGRGANAVSRSQAAHEREIAYLQKKWGAHLRVRRTKTAIRLVVNVDRGH